MRVTGVSTFKRRSDTNQYVTSHNQMLHHFLAYDSLLGPYRKKIVGIYVNLVLNGDLPCNDLSLDSHPSPSPIPPFLPLVPRSVRNDQSVPFVSVQRLAVHPVSSSQTKIKPSSADEVRSGLHIDLVQAESHDWFFGDQQNPSIKPKSLGETSKFAAACRFWLLLAAVVSQPFADSSKN